jgi:hypothetical protein
MSKFRNTSVLGGHWIYRSCFQRGYDICSQNPERGNHLVRVYYPHQLLNPFVWRTKAWKGYNEIKKMYIDHAFKFCLKYQGTNYFIVFWFIFMKKTKFWVLLEHFQEFHEKPMSCFYQITKTLSFFSIFGSKFLDKWCFNSDKSI